MRHIRIDGSTPPAVRAQHCERFQTDPEVQYILLRPADTLQCRAAVLSITAAGVGLTLHAANCVVFAELFWNPGQLLQVRPSQLMYALPPRRPRTARTGSGSSWPSTSSTSSARDRSTTRSGR